MYDRETDTLWSQFLGQGVDGPLEGASLEAIPSQLISWAGWKRQYPDTSILETLDTIFDPYMSYYSSQSAGTVGEANEDRRLPRKAVVKGILGEAGQHAYSFHHLFQRQVINDTFEETDIVVAYDRRYGAATVYRRTIDAQVFTFGQAEDLGHMTDEESGSTWDKASGLAVDGTMEGQRLELVQSFATFWFAWTDFYPETGLYTPEEAP